jgi:hypothetical protein
MPTGNIDEELIILKKHFKGVEGKIAEKDLDKHKRVKLAVVKKPIIFIKNDCVF